VLSCAATTKVLDGCRGRGFAALRDTAIVRLQSATGARLAEMAALHVADVEQWKRAGGATPAI
jgi:site-specific recombinase XerD